MSEKILLSVITSELQIYFFRDKVGRLLIDLEKRNKNLLFNNVNVSTREQKKITIL